MVGKKSLQNWLYKAPPRENTQTSPPYHLKFEIRQQWIVLRLFLCRELLHTVFTSVCRCIIYRSIKCILNQVMLDFVDHVVWNTQLLPLLTSFSKYWNTITVRLLQNILNQILSLEYFTGFFLTLSNLSTILDFCHRYSLYLTCQDSYSFVILLFALWMGFFNNVGLNYIKLCRWTCLM